MNTTIEHLVHDMIIERVTPIAEVVQDIVNNGAKVDVETLKAELLEALKAELPVPAKVTVEIKWSGKEAVKKGAHPELPLLLAYLSQPNHHDRNVYLYGTAGTGKTTLAMEVAKVMELPLYMQGSAMSKYDLLGFKLPSGEVVRTAFMDAWCNGGVIVLDDWDRSDPKALASLNAATANGTCDFSHCGLGLVPRHPDCYILATGNTAMNGQDATYSAASKQDGALRDRFTFHHLVLNEALEREIAPHAEWCKRVQKIRAAAAELGGKVEQSILTTMRATIMGGNLAATGALNQVQIENAIIFKGASDDVRTLIYSKVGKPSTKVGEIVV